MSNETSTITELSQGFRIDTSQPWKITAPSQGMRIGFSMDDGSIEWLEPGETRTLRPETLVCIRDLPEPDIVIGG